MPDKVQDKMYRDRRSAGRFRCYKSTSTGVAASLQRLINIVHRSIASHAPGLVSEKACHQHLARSSQHRPEFGRSPLPLKKIGSSCAGHEGLNSLS
jgi:hypothetical protein